MPLVKSGKPGAIAQNIKTELGAKKDRRQAIAIAESIADKAKGVPRVATKKTMGADAAKMGKKTHTDLANGLMAPGPVPAGHQGMQEPGNMGWSVRDATEIQKTVKKAPHGPKAY